MALSRAAMKSALDPLFVAIGGPASVPSGLSRIRTCTTISCGFFAPAGGVHSCASRARRASSSLIDSVVALPLGVPSEAVLLGTSPAAASLVAVCLLSSAST